MPFDPADPRTALIDDGKAAVAATSFAAAQFLRFTDDLAECTDRGTRTWYVRMQNAVVAYTVGVAGDQIGLIGESSERLLALPDTGTGIEICRGNGLTVVWGAAAVVVPPGATTINFLTSGPVVQMFPADAAEVLGRCINADAYATVPPNVAVHRAAPAQERAVVVHPLADHPSNATRFGSIFRSTNLMINFINDRLGPRDPAKLSPHSHADFEQCSIQLGGRFVHHVRTPWTPDQATWRPDEHVEVDGPAAILFPPPMVHTSQAIGSGRNRLLDAFAPPRADFLGRPGWVLNAADYRVVDSGDLVQGARQGVAR